MAKPGWSKTDPRWPRRDTRRQERKENSEPKTASEIWRELIGENE